MLRLVGCRNLIAACFLCAVTAIGASAQTFTRLFAFDGTDGAEPLNVTPVQGPDGNFYGTTWFGGNLGCTIENLGCGTIFKITPAGHNTKLYEFCTENDCGSFPPYAGLALGLDGNFYGTTAFNGYSPNVGTIFKITSQGELTTLHTFDGTDGTDPYDALVLGTDGNFYGTTFYGGGLNNGGTIFRISPEGVFTSLYSFCTQGGCPDGIYPNAGLIQAADGNFYGTTIEGGTNNHGTIYRITPGGTFTTLYSIGSRQGTDEGIYPYGAVLQASDGNLYGTTQMFGAYGAGTIYRVSLQGVFQTIYAFPQGQGGSTAQLIQGTDGNLYGITAGLNGGYGTIFSLTLSGNFTTLHNFVKSDGTVPYGGLLQATNGELLWSYEHWW